MVLHFGEAGDTATTARNAARPGAPAAVSGATAGATGQIAGALGFDDETDQVLPAGSSPLIADWSALHVTFWLRLHYASDAEWEAQRDAKVIEQWDVVQAGRTYPTGGPGQGSFQVDVRLVRSGFHFLHGAIGREGWEHLALSLDGEQLVLYVNGRAAAQASVAADALSRGEHPLTLGASAFGWRSFRGHLDELRVGPTARSAAWIAAEHANQAAPEDFVSVGPLETVPE